MTPVAQAFAVLIRRGHERLTAPQLVRTVNPPIDVVAVAEENFRAALADYEHELARLLGGQPRAYLRGRA